MLRIFKNLKNRKRELTVFFILLVAVFLFSFNFAHAQSPELGMNYAGNLGLEKSDKDPRDFIVDIIKYFITFLGLIAVVMVMYSGFLWMTSEGDPEKINKAKKTLINSVIGLIIALFSFAIVAFIANLMNGGGGGSGIGSGRRPDALHGYGVIGACSVESVYPEPNQKDVPRDTAIVITFKEEVDISTMEDSPGHVDTDRIRIFHADEADSCVPNGACSSLSDALVTTNDNLTFFISPINYLGSPSEYIWYSVYLNNEIELADGKGVFDTCRSDFLRWDFEVSNRLDMIPPQVKENGVFPDPDNDQDTEINTSAVQATGAIQLLNNPFAFEAASVGTAIPGGTGWNSADTSISETCSEGGSYTVTINYSNPDQANLRRDSVLLGSANFSGDQINFSYCGISLTYSSDFADIFDTVAGDAFWTFHIIASREADTLTVGSTVYEFGEDIGLGSDEDATALNTASILNARSNLEASVNPSGSSRVLITSAQAGIIGNNILLDTNNPTNLEINLMQGGIDIATTYNVVDKKDKARNAIVQINFNEAINPLTVSGLAIDTVDYIRVKCFENDGITPCSGSEVFVCDGANSCINGHFEVSNQYRTVEFISDNQCGVNACGEDIYCLPGNTNLVVEIEAADLTTCPSPTDCSTRSPYNNCSGNPGVCRNAAGVNLPKALFPLNGITDMSSNSLDGNRDTFATGSVSFYDENQGGPSPDNGDNYRWSFYINNLIDISAPTIISLSPSHDTSDVDLEAPLEIEFDEIMMSSSLRTGQTEIYNGQDYFRHKLINLWNFANLPLGYWISSENIDTSSPLDGAMDQTRILIKHSSFYDSISYRSQIGSGVKDIYQNCFKPSAGPDCTATDVLPSCCPSGTGLNAVNNTGINPETGNCL